jgi:hypothetical protein
MSYLRSPHGRRRAVRLAQRPRRRYAMLLEARLLRVWALASEPRLAHALRARLSSVKPSGAAPALSQVALVFK